jgi:hypothetical protein
MVARKSKTVGTILFLAVAGLAVAALWFAIPTMGHIDIKYDGLSTSGVYWMPIYSNHLYARRRG